MNKEGVVQKKWQLTACKVSEVRSKIKKERNKIKILQKLYYIFIKICMKLECV